MDPQVQNAILSGLPLPIGVALASLALAWFVWGWGERPRAALALTGLGLAGAVVAGVLVRFGMPGVPTKDSAQWVFWTALLGALWGVAEAALLPNPADHGRARRSLMWLGLWAGRALIVALALAAAGWRLLENTWSPGEGARHLAPAAVAALLVWWGLAAHARRARGLGGTLPVCVPASLIAVLLVTTGSLKLGEGAGFLAAGLGSACVVSVLRPRLSLQGGGVAVVAVVLASQLFLGVHLSELPAWMALTAAGGLVLPALGAFTPVGSLTGWKRALADTALGAAPGLIAMGFAVPEAIARSSGAGGY